MWHNQPNLRQQQTNILVACYIILRRNGLQSSRNSHSIKQDLENQHR
uniref:Uncharacterized protein n=1 Tax=Arundo donax TaxID=35708 RepID=A0A0A9AVS6_ARUDO